jgi:hypothetical protein
MSATRTRVTGLRAALPLLLALGLALPARPAHAAARSATLLGVGGADGARFAVALEHDLAELYDLVPAAAYRRLAEETGHRGASPAEVRAVATRLGIDAVIGGAVVGGGHARRLLIAVREGATGRVVARGTYDLGGRTLPLVRERVVHDLVLALDRVRPIGTAPATAPLADDDREPASAGPAGAGEADAATGTVTRAESRRSAVGGVSAGVGPALLTRRFGFDVASAPSYAGGTVFGVRVEGAVFPLALSSELAEEHPVLASFGLAGSFEQIIDFTSSTTSGGRSVGHASRWNALLLSRIPLGHGARGGLLLLDTGFQRMSWSHAAPVDVAIPDVRYDVIAAGVGWERALIPRWAALGLRAGYLGVIHSGEISGGAEYGAASGWGLSASASLTTAPLSWLWLRLRGDYDFIGLRFAGAGTRFAHSSADHWIGGALEVGFVL